MLIGFGGLILVVGFVVSGLVMIFRARRKGRPYPSCGQCGYDVTGTLGTAVRCPECGLDFAEAGILPGRTRTNRPLLVAGIFMLVAGGGCLGSGLVSATIAMRSAAAAQQQAIMARQQAILAQQQLVQAELEAQQAAADAEAEATAEAVEASVEAADGPPPR